MMNQIINRLSGYSDEDMYRYCKLLKDTLESTVVQKGEEVRRFSADPETEEKIDNSIKFYLDKMQKGNIEFRDYQLQIISTGQIQILIIDSCINSSLALLSTVINVPNLRKSSLFCCIR